jgi:hypothetical protein
MTVLRWLESVSSRVAAPTTSTVSVIAPGFMVRSTRWRAPTRASMLSARATENPSSSLVTL